MDYKKKNASDTIQLGTEQHLSIRRESAGREIRGGEMQRGRWLLCLWIHHANGTQLSSHPCKEHTHELSTNTVCHRKQVTETV